MIRTAAAIAVVLSLSSVPLHAQSTKLTVNVVSASVYRSPSVASPVIGHAARGEALEVTREVGDWVKVSWPAAADGVGYVRASMGSIARGVTATPARTATPAAAPRPVSSAAAPAAPAVRAEQQPLPRGSAPTPARAVLVAPTHTVGIGARLGGATMGIGASMRGWSERRLGGQFDLSHYSITSATEAGRMSATQVAPSVLFAMKDHVGDFVWARPYVGAGLDWTHATLTVLAPAFSDSANTLGVRMFAGSEFTFSSAPQFGVSVDLGYYHMPAPFVGFDAKGIGAAVAGHWYMK
jgi:Bacterial SH3 domain